jgi:hypothetical protein
MAGQYVEAYLKIPFFDPGAILKLETGDGVVVSKNNNARNLTLLRQGPGKSSTVFTESKISTFKKAHKNDLSVYCTTYRGQSESERGAGGKREQHGS